MTGMHWAFVPACLLALADPGYDVLLTVAMLSSNTAQAVATFGVAFKTLSLIHIYNHGQHHQAHQQAHDVAEQAGQVASGQTLSLIHIYQPLIVLAVARVGGGQRGAQ